MSVKCVFGVAGIREFRQRRISLRLAEMTGISPKANILSACRRSASYRRSAPRMRTRSRYARRGSRHLFQTKRPPQGWPFCLEQMTGIEPAFLAWEANALPLSYICIRNLRQLLYRKGVALSMAFLNFVVELRPTENDVTRENEGKSGFESQSRKSC